MARIESSSLPNGLPLHRIELPTRSTTVLVAFDAGARTEHAEENGMAHFLEHLVFKGGQKYDDYRKVNQTAETMGAVLNAYTSHDLVAFHITCRAEVAAEAIDLLTDFVGPPEDRRRGARPRARRRDPGDRARARPAVGARRAPDRPRRVRRSPARAARCSAPRSTCARSRATPILAFRRRQWVGSRGGAFLVGNLDHLPENSEMAELFGRFPSISSNGGSEPAPAFAPTTLVETRESTQSHLRMSYRPKIDAARPRRARRAGRLLDAARRLDGLAAVRRDPRAARPRLLRLRARPLLRRRADPAALRRPGLDEVRRGLQADGRDRRRAAHRRADRGGGRARPRVRRRPPRARLREHQRRRPLRRVADGGLQPGHRPRQGDRSAGRGHLRRGRRGRPRDLRDAVGRLRRTPYETSSHNETLLVGHLWATMLAG